MNIDGSRIFISGGAGVIGNELVDVFLNRNCSLYVGDLKPQPTRWIGRLVYRQGDLNYITPQELNNFNPEYFFHLAATFERSTETYDFWFENFHHNIKLSNHLMTLLKDSAFLKKVVFASSYLIYDPVLYNFKQPAENAVSLKETDAISPRNLTGMAKLFHEIELRFLNEFKNAKYKSVLARIYRGYGKNSRDIISRWIRALLQGESITLYNKENVFDYIYAADSAEGLLRLAETDSAEGIVNLGTGKARKVDEVIAILRSHFPEMAVSETESEILYEASQADVSRLRELTGWVPAYTLEKAIPEIIEFEKNKANGEAFELQNVLVTSISKKIPLLKEMRRAINKISSEAQLFGADLNKDCIGRFFVDKFWAMPSIKDISPEVLIDYCKTNNIGSIIPTRDGELLFFAQNRDLLEEYGISVMVSNQNTVKTCIDKLSFFQKLNSAGFPVIFTDKDINKIKAETFVVKERFGAGAEKIMLNIDKISAKSIVHNFSNAIFQPFIEGKEYSIDIYSDRDANVKGAIVRTRDIVENGESQITTTINNSDLEILCTKMAGYLNLQGHSIFQILVDEKNNHHIIECNCRFGGASTLSISSGLDSFYWFLLESSGIDISQYKFYRTQSELKQIRFPQDLILEAYER